MTRPLALSLLAATLGTAALAQTPKADYPAARAAKWEKEVAGIEKAIADGHPKEGSTVFAGSSTVRLWDLKKYFPGKEYVNAGFGGSTIADCVHFAPRLVLPHKPAAVVFSAGGNDLASGTAPEKVADDFKAFAAAVHGLSPKCRVVFVSIKPTTKRWGLYEKETKANALIKSLCAADERLVYLDLVPDLLGSDGKPKPEMLKADLLHPSPAGYDVMAAKVSAALAK